LVITGALMSVLEGFQGKKAASTHASRLKPGAQEKTPGSAGFFLDHQI